MPDPHEPWRRPGGPRRASRGGLVLWLALAGGVLLLIWGLNRYFPGAVTWDLHSGWIFYYVALVALISSGLIFGRRIPLGEAARNIALWAGVAAILAVGYVYRDTIRSTFERVQSGMAPGEPVATGPHTLILTADEGGGFAVYGTVNGVRVHFAVDTGASDIVLSPADAKRVGIDTAALRYDRVYETANGIGHGAAVTLNDLTIGPITQFNVPASVNKAPMRTSLLGMSFLRRLKSFEASKDRLVLRW